MKYQTIFILLFLYYFKTFCSEQSPISQVPAQQVMGITAYPIPQYYAPRRTLPIVKKTVYHRIDTAIIDLHSNEFQPSSQALTKTAETIAHQVTLKRKIGVSSLILGAGTTIIIGSSPLGISHPEIPIGGIIIAACGAGITCDSMCECCCWKQKMASTKKMIRENHLKIN